MKDALQLLTIEEEGTVDRKIFHALFEETADGQLLDINIFDTTAADWQTLLDFLPTKFVCAYLEDHARVCTVPVYTTIAERREFATLLLSIDIDGITINTHFFRTETIKFDILPNEVDTPEKADKIIGFMQSLSQLLKKDVFLDEENGSASDDWLRERALAWTEAPRGIFRFSET